MFRTWMRQLRAATGSLLWETQAMRVRSYLGSCQPGSRPSTAGEMGREIDRHISQRCSCFVTHHIHIALITLRGPPLRLTICFIYVIYTIQYMYAVHVQQYQTLCCLAQPSSHQKTLEKRSGGEGRGEGRCLDYYANVLACTRYHTVMHIIFPQCTCVQIDIIIFA